MYDEKFKVCFGGVILIGVLYKSNNESVEQLWSTLDGWLIFNRTMSRGRYQQILRFFRLTMHIQDDIIGPLISCNQSEKCLKLGTLTWVTPTPADQA